MLRLYRDYASTAARPCARARWEAEVRRAQRGHIQGDGNAHINLSLCKPPSAPRVSARTYWEAQAPVKPARVLKIGGQVQVA
jgi:hypothetical protein